MVNSMMETSLPVCIFIQVMALPTPMGVAINRVITMMYRVFNRLPAIPVVCFLALVTVVKMPS